MENYIITKRFKGEAICGNVNLAYGTKLYHHAGAIWLDADHPLCYDHAQNAYDYMARDDDGMGLKRGELIRDIMARLAKRDSRDDPKYQARWDVIWDDPTLRRFKRDDFDDYWLWNYDFYNADIADLEYILNKIKEVKYNG